MIAIPITIVILILLGIWLFLIAPKNRKEMERFKSVHYAHRGLHNAERAENSMSAFKAAVDGGWGIELDIRLSKDGKLVVFHDDTLDRVCGREGKVIDFTSEELATFKLLISVSGVGPKAAMSILTLLTPEKFALAVCTDDKKTISKANGIGPKTAARVILELKDKLMKENPTAASMPASITDATSVGGGRGKLSEAVDALLVLGYSRAEAMNAVKDIDTDKIELEEIIRLSLKKLMKF
jgi:Holliday junction DNA helicase RuvA subunit